MNSPSTPLVWSQVTLEHIGQACEMYDSGAARPKRPAQSTFLLWNGKTYPAKFIRGLAYRLATGIQLDPSRDFAGGLETVKFFQGLGLATQHGSSVVTPAAVLASQPPPPAGQVQPVPQRRYEPQKAALLDCLRRRFREVVTEANFPWLMVPRQEQMDGCVSAILQALQGMRGHTAFATFGKALHCDFFMPSERLVIEYDERQHFTLQRAKALELYPPELALRFDREEWLTACRRIKANDPTPPYRDEQRAFYDSLRDILAARNGTRLIRLRYGTFDWTGSGADDHLAGLLAGAVTGNLPAARPAHSAAATAQVKKVALISHDYNLADSAGLCDYSEHFAQINRLCDEQGCDTILYALYTWDRDSARPRTHAAVFDGLVHVQRIVLEIWQRPDIPTHVEVWFRGQEAPVNTIQRFATSSSPDSSKRTFFDDLPNRRVGDALLVICGETNIASTVRGSDDFFDPFGFVERLREMNVQVILNPIHDYMTRYEMRRKRCCYSLGGRTVISVWNQGRGKESALPWTAFHNGTERTDAVQELPRPFTDRADIRIGVLDLSTL